MSAAEIGIKPSGTNEVPRPSKVHDQIFWAQNLWDPKSDLVINILFKMVNNMAIMAIHRNINSHP